MRGRHGMLAFAAGLMFAGVCQAELFPGDDPSEVFVATPVSAPQAEPAPGRDEDEASAMVPAEPSVTGATSSPESPSACEARLFSFSYRTGKSEALVAMHAKHSSVGGALQSRGISGLERYE